MAKKSNRLSRKRWREQRRRVWLRDDCKCARCGKELLLSQAHIDHIKPISEGGRNYMGNLRTLCIQCHSTRAEKSHYRLWLKCVKQGLITGDEELWT